MQLCEEVTDGLVAKGHKIAVLTSTRRDGPEIDRPYSVHRLLTIDPDWGGKRSAAWQFFVGRKQREAENVAYLQQVVSEFQPDLLFVWHAIGLSRVMLQTAESLPQPTVYYFAGYLPELPDEYIAFWQEPPVHWTAKLVKHPLATLVLVMLRREGKPIHLQYEHVICVSEYVRQRLVKQGLVPEIAVVIHNGIDTGRFKSSITARDFRNRIRLLYAGRLEADKGVHNVLEALTYLEPSQLKQIEHLAVVGDGVPSYVAMLQSIVEQNNLSGSVKFLPAMPRDDMPGLLDDYDVLIQPSALEALSRMMQEAMAMGLLVIGTIAGGSGELLEHGKTGLVFTTGDAKSLAQQLVRVITKPNLARQLAQAGRKTVQAEFNIKKTTDKIEQYLQEVLGL